MDSHETQGQHFKSIGMCSRVTEGCCWIDPQYVWEVGGKSGKSSETPQKRSQSKFWNSWLEQILEFLAFALLEVPKSWRSDVQSIFQNCAPLSTARSLSYFGEVAFSLTNQTLVSRAGHEVPSSTEY